MGRYFDIEPHIAGLRRFALALVLQRNDTSEATARRADAIVQRCVASAMATGEATTAGDMRLLLLNAAIQHNRARLRQEKFFAGSEPMAGRHYCNAAAEAESMPPEQRATRKAMAQLPVDCREVMLLVVLAELSYVDAAQILGLSLSETFARLTRARLAFGGALGQQLEAGMAAPGDNGRQVAGMHGPRRAAAQHLRLVK